MWDSALSPLRLWHLPCACAGRSLRSGAPASAAHPTGRSRRPTRRPGGHHPRIGHHARMSWAPRGLTEAGAVGQAGQGRTGSCSARRMSDMLKMSADGNGATAPQRSGASPHHPLPPRPSGRGRTSSTRMWTSSGGVVNRGRRAAASELWPWLSRCGSIIDPSIHTISIHTIAQGGGQWARSGRCLGNDAGGSRAT